MNVQLLRDGRISCQRFASDQPARWETTSFIALAASRASGRNWYPTLACINPDPNP